MGLTLADSYFLKAKGATGFYSDWEEACESLNYALSYDENHCASLCLLGKIYAEHFSNYEQAFECFDKIIANHPEYLEVYPIYARTLIWNDEIERSQRLISHALKLKGVDKAELYCILAQGLEIKRNYNLALSFIHQATIETYNENYRCFLKDEKHRLKRKLKRSRKVIS